MLMKYAKFIAIVVVKDRMLHIVEKATIFKSLITDLIKIEGKTQLMM